MSNLWTRFGSFLGLLLGLGLFSSGVHASWFSSEPPKEFLNREIVLPFSGDDSTGVSLKVFHDKAFKSSAKKSWKVGEEKQWILKVETKDTMTGKTDLISFLFEASGNRLALTQRVLIGDTEIPKPMISEFMLRFLVSPDGKSTLATPATKPDTEFAINPIVNSFECMTKDLIVSVDEVKTESYRYRAWSKKNGKKGKPDLELLNGNRSIDGQREFRYTLFIFNSGSKEYRVGQLSPTEDAPKAAFGNLIIEEGSKTLLEQWCYPA